MYYIYNICIYYVCIYYICMYIFYIYYIFFFFDLAIPILEINPKKIIGCVQKINDWHSYCNIVYGIAN